MFRRGLTTVLRKPLRRKFLIMLILGLLIFLYGLMKRERQDKSFHLSWSKRKELLEIASRQRSRRQMISNHCKGRSLHQIMPAGSENHGVPRDLFKHVIVNDKYRFLYCQAPKVATSNWKRVFLVLNGNASNPWQITSSDVHSKTRGYFRYLHEYSPSDILVRLKTYYKFLFVRHPFERLASAYRNKFVESYNLTFFAKIYGRYIIRKFRKHINIEDTSPVSFTEFINYILEGTDDVMDNHWRLYDDLCRPCLIFYDFVGHFEELGRDSSDFLRVLDLTDKVSFPANISSNYEVPTAVLARKYFSELPRSFKDRLYRKYRNDFEMFGYAAPRT